MRSLAKPSEVGATIQRQDNGQMVTVRAETRLKLVAVILKEHGEGALMVRGFDTSCEAVVTEWIARRGGNSLTLEKEPV